MTWVRTRRARRLSAISIGNFASVRSSATKTTTASSQPQTAMMTSRRMYWSGLCQPSIAVVELITHCTASSTRMRRNGLRPRVTDSTSTGQCRPARRISHADQRARPTAASSGDHDEEGQPGQRVRLRISREGCQEHVFNPAGPTRTGHGGASLIRCDPSCRWHRPHQVPARGTGVGCGSLRGICGFRWCESRPCGPGLRGTPTETHQPLSRWMPRSRLRNCRPSRRTTFGSD